MKINNAQPYIGALTALINGNIAMTVTSVNESDSEDGKTGTIVECVYYTGSTLKNFYADVSAFVGFGDALCFECGAFTFALSLQDEEGDPDDSDDIGAGDEGA